MKQLLVGIGAALVLAGQAYAAEPQKFKTEESATKFCHQGNVVWVNPDSKIYFAPGSQFYNHTKVGGFSCKASAEKSGYRAAATDAAQPAPPPATRMDNTVGAPPPASRMNNTVGAPPPASRMQNTAPPAPR